MAGDAVDNTVSGVWAGYEDYAGIGIELLGVGSKARGNLVRRVSQSADGYSVGLWLGAANQIAMDNRLMGSSWNIHGIRADKPGALCRGNTLTRWRIPLEGCAYAPENLLQ